MSMEAQTEPEAEVRIPLSRERVLRAAVGLADEGGIESLTMRRLAERLGSEPMSLYYHVALLRKRILAAREILLSHPWAPTIIESRTNMSISSLRYFDSLIGLLLEAGFSIDLAHHALHALGSRALGFTQEMYDDSEPLDDEALAVFLEQVADEYPHISTMVKGISHDADTTLGWCDDQFEFEFGLDLILDGLERLRG